MGEPEGTGIAGLHSRTATDPGIGDAEERPTTTTKLGVTLSILCIDLSGETEA